jgi:hypothetical protein
VVRRVDEVEDEDEEGKQAVFMSMREEAPMLFKYLYVGSSGRDKVVVREGVQKTALKGAHLGPLNEGGRAYETRGAHLLLTLLARWEC